MESDSDRILILAISKSILYICMTIILCFLFSTCTVDKSIIVQCEESCDNAGIKMKSVTARECTCGTPETFKEKTSNWVLP